MTAFTAFSHSVTLLTATDFVLSYLIQKVEIAMSIDAEIQKIKAKAEAANQLLTEEATKFSLVMPILNILGYNVFDHTVVIPEFTADVGIKKGEKVDFAIKIASKIAILIEAKSAGTDLSQAHAGQLFRYFSVTEARFSCLTNGVQWWFFTDLDNKNKMDDKPFFRFDLRNYDASDLSELEKFSAAQFSIDGILSAASDLKFRSLIADQVRLEMSSPSDDLVKLIAKRVHSGNMTADVKARFSTLLTEAFRDVVREQVRQSLSNALARSDVNSPSIQSNLITPSPLPSTGGETTEEEMDGFRIIRAISAQSVDPKRIVIRDAASYCAVLFDDNNRKPIARLYLNGSKKRIGLFKDKIEEKVDINSIEEIYKYSKQILEALVEHMPKD